MNRINTIYTTVSKGQVHIAADSKYIGRVDSYNNCFTQFFAWLFGRSVTVNFDGKLRSINKESYAKLIQKLVPHGKMNDIGSRTVFKQIAEVANLPLNDLKMRDVIPVVERQVLFQKLAMAISCGDTTKALLMIGKGAEVDTEYYDRDQLGLSFSLDTLDLSPNSAYQFTVFKASPMLQAARKSDKRVVQFLKEFGANVNAKGKEYAFKREITNIETHVDVVVEPQLVPHHHHTQDARGENRERVSHEIEYRPAIRERTIVKTRDSRSEPKHYRLNQYDDTIMEEGALSWGEEAGEG